MVEIRAVQARGVDMVVLTDAMISAIENATKPLQPSERLPFQSALLEQLLYYRDEIGEGTLGRLLRELQQKHFKPPIDTEGLMGARFNSRSAFKSAVKQRRPDAPGNTTNGSA